MYKLFTDGGARNNPGPAAIGGILYKDKEVVDEFTQYIGEATNNKAEYEAILYGLKLALRYKVKDLDCYLDSELVVQQLNRKYKVKDKDLAKLFVKVWNTMQEFKKITFSHVAREDNKEADKLVNKALDQNI